MVLFATLLNTFNLAQGIKIMKTIIKLFLMSHSIPVRIASNDSVRFYKTVAKLHGLSVEKSLYGYVLN